MGRVRIGLATVVTTVALVASVAPAVAATKGTDAVTASAAPGSKLAPHTHYYRLNARPGTSLTQTVHLENRNKHAISVRIAGIDGYTSDATGAAYTTPGRLAKTTGKWVVVSTPELTMQAGEKRDVDFTVHVPPTAKPGEYLAAVGMWVPLASSTTTLPGGASNAGFAITLQGERVIAVEIVVPGPQRSNLVVTAVKPAVGPNGLWLQLGIANTGNAFTHGSGVVTVADTNLDFPFKIDTFVSHTAINFRVPWTRTVVPGDHPVSIKLTYDGKRVTTWNGSITIAGSLQRRLMKDLHDTKVGAPAPARDWSRLLLPAGLVAVFVCAVGAIVLRRRSRRAPLPAG